MNKGISKLCAGNNGNSNDGSYGTNTNMLLYTKYFVTNIILVIYFTLSISLTPCSFGTAFFIHHSLFKVTRQTDYFLATVFHTLATYVY